MILKMENYSYPTREEWLEVSRSFPDMGRFGFSGVKGITLLLEREKSIKEVHQIQNLYHWDLVLNTKIWNLRQSYVNTLVNFNRGIAQTDKEFRNEVKVIHLKQFEFYFETTLYYLISARDIIYQIVNLAFVEDFLAEKEVILKRILVKVQPLHLRDILIRSSNSLEAVNDFRNSMAHRFPKNATDYRSSVSDDGKRYSSFKRKLIDYDKSVEILKTGIKNFHQFYIEIRSEIDRNFPLDT